MYREENKPKRKRSRLRRIFSLKNQYGQWHIGRIMTGLILLIILGLVFFFGMFYNVSVGEGMMIVDPVSGSISNPILGPTYGIKMPWQQSIYVYLATDSLGMWGNGSDQYADFPSIACFSRDQLEMEIDVQVRWQLDPMKIKDLYRNYPMLNWKTKAIASIIREQIRITTKGWSAIETIENRDLVRLKIAEAIEEKLNSEPSLVGAIINMEFELRNIAYPESYTQAIENKLAAEQSKIQAEYEKQRKIILAEAEAQALLISANATAQQKVIDAQGIQEAIQTLISGTNMTDEEFNNFINLYVTLKALENISEKEGIYFFIGFENGLPVLIPQPTSPEG